MPPTEAKSRKAGAESLSKSVRSKVGCRLAGKQHQKGPNKSLCARGTSIQNTDVGEAGEQTAIKSTAASEQHRPGREPEGRARAGRPGPGRGLMLRTHGRWADLDSGCSSGSVITINKNEARAENN